MASHHAATESPARWYAAGLFLVYAVLLFAHTAQPGMTDYANWTYQGVLLARHVQGFADTSHAVKHYPVPNSAATLGIGFFSLFLPWTIAAKAWLCVQMSISYLALRHLARTISADAAAWFIVPQAVFLGVNWWYGFVNFQLGCAWMLLVASLLLRRISGTRNSWTLGAVLVVTFFTHMIPFAFCCVLVMLYAAQTRRWKSLWQLSPVVLLTTWYLVGRYMVAADADGQSGMVSSVRNYSAAFWAYKANSFLKSFGFVNPEGSDLVLLVGRAGFAALFLLNLVLAILLGWWMMRAGLRALRTRSEERFLWVGIASLVPLYLLAPGAALGVSDPGSRLLQTAIALALVLCCRYPGWQLRAAMAASALLAVVVICLFARFAFLPGVALQDRGSLPKQVVDFAHVPNHDQDFFYQALDRGDYQVQVFPTGMFLNHK